MCRVEERVYITADGHRSRFEDTFPCDKSRKGKLCADAKKRTTEYYPKKGGATRSDTPSPVNPPTPTGTGAYIVQRRPSSSGGRPPTRDSASKNLIIEFASSKSKGKKYPSVSISAKPSNYKRSSLGTSSNDDIAVNSPGSDDSHTLYTGFVDAPLATYGQPNLPHGYHHHRHTSSTSSYSSSSQPPSLLVTSDPELDSPPNGRSARLPPAIHNTYAPPSPTKPRASVGGYNITLITPKDPRQSESLSPRDHQDRGEHSGSSRASSGASGKSRRGKEPERSGGRRDEERRRQEEMDREVAEALARDENKKQVRFEVGRAEARANERAENLVAQKEKERAAAREEARRHEQQMRDEQVARQHRKEKERQKSVVVSNSSSKRPGSRRGSMTMTRVEQEEQRRLLAADAERMQAERWAAEAREREERAATLREQQQDTAYYNPRTGLSTNAMPAPSSGLVRRDSQSRRNSLSSEARPVLGRSNSHARRTSIVQPNPPIINTQLAPSNGYTRATPSTREHRPPPLAYHNTTNGRPPSARRPSFSSQDLPAFTSPPARTSGSSMDNPFAAPLSPPTAVIHQDPWDARSISSALPAATSRQGDGRYTIERRGQEVLSQAAQTSRRMNAMSAFESDSEDDAMTHEHGRRRR